MSRNRHDHITNRIWKRSKAESKDGLYVELEEGSRVTHLQTYMRLRDAESKKLLGHVSVKAVVQGSAPLLNYIPETLRNSLFKELLIRSDIEIISAVGKKGVGIDYGKSILKELTGRHADKSSVDWFTFFVFSSPEEKEDEDFDMHRHGGPIVATPEEFEGFLKKEGEVGVALIDGYWTCDFEEDSEVVDINGRQIGTARILLVIDTRIIYAQELKSVINISNLIFKAEHRWSKSLVKKRLGELYGKKSDAGWFSMVYYLPKSILILNQ